MARQFKRQLMGSTQPGFALAKAWKRAIRLNGDDEESAMHLADALERVFRSSDVDKEIEVAVRNTAQPDRIDLLRCICSDACSATIEAHGRTVSLQLFFVPVYGFEEDLAALLCGDEAVGAMTGALISSGLFSAGASVSVLPGYAFPSDAVIGMSPSLMLELTRAFSMSFVDGGVDSQKAIIESAEAMGAEAVGSEIDSDDSTFSGRLILCTRIVDVDESDDILGGGDDPAEWDEELDMWTKLIHESTEVPHGVMFGDPGHIHDAFFELNIQHITAGLAADAALHNISLNEQKGGVVEVEGEGDSLFIKVIIDGIELGPVEVPAMLAELDPDGLIDELKNFGSVPQLEDAEEASITLH